jgi:hypothetical protein
MMVVVASPKPSSPSSSVEKLLKQRKLIMQIKVCLVLRACGARCVSFVSTTCDALMRGEIVSQ